MSENIHQYMHHLGAAARRAAAQLAAATTMQKNAALHNIASQIKADSDAILAANLLDMRAGKQKQLDAALLDRLELNRERIEQMAAGVLQVAALDDPIGQIEHGRYLPSGIQISQLRVPLGVIGIIYESRPNVTVDAAVLCLKSGNAAILRGGSEALYSNQAIGASLQTALQASDLPISSVQIANTSSRELVGAMLGATEYIDVLIPRGGKSLVTRISAEARVPVIKHLDGNCHVYIDKYADLNKAIAIAINSKSRRYGVCNAMETLLIHHEIADKILPDLASQFAELGVQLRGCKRARALAASIAKADKTDWDTEYLAPILAVKIVDDLSAAIAHINQHGSAHSDAIVSQDISRARRFVREVDSSSVMVNAATSFADGFEYGLGAEIGISTDKLHARGPVGLIGLTSQKYVVIGEGHIRA